MMVCMGQYKSLYVNDDELQVLAQAEAYAKAHRMKFSGLVMAALEAYLADHDGGTGRR
jgi:hypothetical protein